MLSFINFNVFNDSLSFKSRVKGLMMLDHVRRLLSMKKPIT